MPARSAKFAIAGIIFISLLAALTVYFSSTIDLSKFQQSVSTQEGLAALQGINNPGALESALKQNPSNNLLRLMARTTKAINDTKVAVDRLSAQIEPARLSKEPDFGSA